jgi:hypothetical protein
MRTRPSRCRPGGVVHDLTATVSLQLNDHALHSWDTAVTFDPTARIAPGSVPLLLDNLLEGPTGWWPG